MRQSFGFCLLLFAFMFQLFFQSLLGYIRFTILCSFQVYSKVNLLYKFIRMDAKSLQLCLTLCDPMDCSPLGSSVRRDSPGKNARVVAMPSSRGSSQPRDLNLVSYDSSIGKQVFNHQCHLGSPQIDPLFSDSFPIQAITDY